MYNFFSENNSSCLSNEKMSRVKFAMKERILFLPKQQSAVSFRIDVWKDLEVGGVHSIKNGRSVVPAEELLGLFEDHRGEGRPHHLRRVLLAQGRPDQFQNLRVRLFA